MIEMKPTRRFWILSHRSFSLSEKDLPLKRSRRDSWLPTNPADGQTEDPNHHPSRLLKLWPIFGNERQMCLSYHGYVAEFGESCVRLPPVNQGSFIDNERIIFLIANF